MYDKYEKVNAKTINFVRIFEVSRLPSFRVVAYRSMVRRCIPMSKHFNKELNIFVNNELQIIS